MVVKLVLLGVLLGALPVRAQESGRTVLARGLFSYEAPPGWTVSDLNAGYPVSQGPFGDGFTPNIHVDLVHNAEPLTAFVEANLQAAQKASGFQLVARTSFVTAAGLDGIRVVGTEPLNGLNLEQTFYFFDAGGDQKIVASACCLAKDGATDAPLFDASLKTFSLE